MRAYLFLITAFACSVSYSQNSLICEDGNETNAFKIQVQFDFDRPLVSYSQRTTPCYVNPYDGYECDYSNPHPYIEKKIEWPTKITIFNDDSVTTKEAVASARLNTEEFNPNEDYWLYISEKIISDGALMSLSISGTLNPENHKFVSGFEWDREELYVSVNTLYLQRIDRPYYLKCTGPH